MNRVIILFFSLSGLILLSCNSVKEIESHEMNSDDRWAKVDSLEGEGLYRSAWDITHDIYSEAKSKGDYQSQYKALCYQLKYANAVEDESELDAIKKLEDLAANADMPLKAIAHNMTAEAYWTYFQNHQWEIMQRTPTPSAEDVPFWDLARFVDACDHHFHSSMDDPASLKQAKIAEIAPELLVSMENSDLRPTLYEMLAFKALQFYQNKNSGLTHPKDFFRIDKTWFYSSGEEFAKHEVSESDTLSFIYRSIKIYQELLNIQEEGSDAWLSTNLERLLFVSSNSSVEGKKGEVDDVFFFEALKKAQEQGSASSMMAEYGYEQARLYSTAAARYEEGKEEDKKGHFSKAEKLCEAIILDYPESRGAKMAAHLKTEIVQRSLQVHSEEIILPSKAGLAKVNYRNIDKVWMRIVTLPKDFLEGENYDQELYLRELCKLNVVKEWCVELPESADHQEHSIETIIPALPTGYYAVISSAGEDFKNKEARAHSSIWVTHIGYEEIIRPEGGMLVRLRNRNLGTPLVNAEVVHFFSEFNQQTRKQVRREFKRYRTDENGEVVIQYSTEGNRYNQDYLELYWNKEFYSTGIYSRPPLQEVSTYQSTSIFADRSLYRPGQTVYFKGIHMNVTKDGPTISADQNIEVVLRDANYQEVFKQTFKSNEFGSFSGTFTLPSSGITGIMTLQSPHGAASFSVEEYKRPKFKVSLDPLEGIYQLAGPVQVSGQAMGYNGAAVTDAEVRYTVERRPVMRWAYWGSWFRPSYTNQEAVQISTGKSTTDASGKFKIDFNAIAGDANGNEEISHFTFEINVEVTDINGETREASAAVNIGEKGLMLSANLPSDLDKNELAKIQLISENLNGVAIPMSGQWELRFIPADPKVKVKRNWEYPQYQGVSTADFEADLPLFYANRAQEEPQGDGELISNGEWNTAVSTELDLSMLKSKSVGRYVLKLIAQDGPKPSEWSSSFMLFDSKKKESAYTEAMKVVDVGGPYKPGDQARIMVSSHWKGMPVQVRLEYDRKIVWQKEVVLSDEQETMTFPIKKEYQEGAFLHITGMRNNRAFVERLTLKVEAIDRLLDISLVTYRDKMLPGSKEEWKLKVKARNGEKAISELLLSMYDASLDQFKMHAWDFNPWRTDYAILGSTYRGFGTSHSTLYAPDWYEQRSYIQGRVFPDLNRFGYYPGNYFGNGMLMQAVSLSGGRVQKSMSRKANVGNMSLDAAASYSEDEAVNEDSSLEAPAPKQKETESTSSGPQVRSNFQETAFFYPDLKTDAEGNLIFSFTMPESLTTWKFQALAHTKKVQTGILSQEMITQKDLMVVPNSPRFLREGDQISLSTKLVSLTEEVQEGKIRLELLDALTMKDISAQLIQESAIKDFNLLAKGSASFDWKVQVPMDYSAITYRFIAEGEKHSDGEEDVLPVLSNRMMVLEIMPFAITKEKEKTFEFDRMKTVTSSSTAVPHALTLEFTANPIWYAVQAMPYMMEYPYDCSEQVFTRFYANTLATSIIKDRPRLREVINTWKDLSPDAFLSNLEKNQELKYVILEETPWVMEAKNESERKKRLSLLLDMNHMADRQKSALDKLIQNQDPSGGWPWFDGMRPSVYITQYILGGLGHLKQLGILDSSDPKLQQCIANAITFLDEEHLRSFREMKKYSSNWIKEDHTGPFEIHYLYTRSFFMEQNLQNWDAFNYYKGQAAEYWLNKGVYMQGMSALALNRLEQKEVAVRIMKSVKEQSMMDEALGMYWKDQPSGWYWYEAGIERHALMVEAFSEIMQDNDAVYGLKQWLIFNKQTNDWETTRATAEACYALLLGGPDWTQDRGWSVQVGNEKFSSTDPSLKTEAGTGYLKRAWSKEEIKPAMSTVKVSKEGEAPAWGALYYQYFEQLDKITSSASPLKVRKQVFKVKQTNTGQVLTELNDGAKLTVGDRIRIRMEVETDREMEYVHIKDMRSSGMEPVDVLSGMVYSGGLGFYKNTRDAASNFFIENLRKGSYVLEYDVFVSHKGNFSNGITTIQCMYAPEFTAHSEGIRVLVE